MKKRNLYILSALAGLTLMTASCSDDFLDQKPKGNYTAETFYASDKAVQKGVEPLYNKAWFDFNRRALIGMGSYRANDAWNPYVSAEFARFQVTAQTEDMGLAWSALYNVVTMSNATLLNIQNHCGPEVTETAKHAAEGECYLMRGWAYFYLLRGWGDNVLFEDNQTMVDNPVRPLNPESDVLKFIVRDFRKAESLLPERGSDHHPSRYAAKAALAKALLAQSGWNASAKGDHSRDEAVLKEVVALCDEVINSGQYTLLPEYEDLFKAQNNDNSETILAMRWADANLGSSDGWGAVNATYSDLAFPEVTDVNVWGGSLVASTDMIDLYNEEPADSFRVRGTFFTPSRHYSYLLQSDGGYTYKHNWMQLKKGILGTKADAGGHLAQMASPLNTYIQRLADVYLIKAEALLGNSEQTTNPEALAAINAVRSRAKVAPYTSLTFDKLMRERRIEFCMEYSNWWDMVTWYRWKPQTMLDFFNNRQHRANEMREGDILRNSDGTFSYRCVPPGVNTWYISNPDNGNVYWNDHIATSETDNTPVAGKGTNVPYTYDYNTLVNSYVTGFQPIVLSEANIFMPYPESDVIQNHYLNEAPQAYDFGE
ncbi:MAG: RagB/SusD family nutrient uptake outer membrane protein [Prevotella sp.]|nr:RagB/SusD family nutrient uptake outer membrane protein [Prevotella sp.]